MVIDLSVKKKSIAYAETFGIGLLEAFACALPTIATDCEGPKSLIETNESGIIVPKNDAAAIAAQIERLIDNPLLREELAEKAYQKCMANFAVPVLARKFVEQVLLTRCAGSSNNEVQLNGRYGLRVKFFAGQKSRSEFGAGEF